MGEGDQRNSKRTATLDPRELARLARESALPSTAEAEDPVDEDGVYLLARAARGSEPPFTGRTVTLDDPLTTSLLAEVTRRARTIEMSPAQLDAALERAATAEADDGEAAPTAAAPASDRGAAKR